MNFKKVIACLGIVTSISIGIFANENNSSLEGMQELFVFPVDSVLDLNVDIDSILEKDLSLTTDIDMPQILVVHTYPDEQYECGSSVVEAGKELVKYLENNYEVSVFHYTDNENEVSKMGAYDRIEEQVNVLLTEYPSIEVIIDIQRDVNPYYNEEIKNTTTTVGISFVNGLNIHHTPEIDSYSANVENNLALSAQMKYFDNLKDNQVIEEIYVYPYKYNSELNANLLITNFGYNTDTLEQVINTIPTFSDTLANVLDLSAAYR
ncbi:MAG: hypothetical protein BEN18_07070 [Epulopiscium sp. Nuni2H_MBin001]|nr:MAG: hypothetical protein BEN18_07070 [Epulopiscium sp. Nuni2H_MBin001]